jgi:predicted nucleic acid binding AN1-type Zn finger protein
MDGSMKDPANSSVTPSMTPLLGPQQAQPQPPIIQLADESAAAIPKNRCATCRKKLSLSDFDCGKCNVRYCGSHRLPEAHNCPHDFKTAGKSQLSKQLTRVVGAKVDVI